MSYTPLVAKHHNGMLCGDDGRVGMLRIGDVGWQDEEGVTR
jgi:hypothetical protein